MGAYLRRVDFLVLAGDQHGCDSQQLQLVPLHLVLDDERVDYELSQEQSFVPQVESQMHVHQPIHQNSPHFLVYLDLVSHYVPQHYILFLTQKLEYLLRILLHHLRVLLRFLRLQTQLLLFVHVYILYFRSKLSEHAFLKGNRLKHLFYYQKKSNIYQKSVNYYKPDKL